MDGVQLYGEIADLESAIEAASDMMDEYDAALPKAERAYQEMKRAVMLELREKVGVTVARETVRGVPEVAELREARDELTYRRQSLRALRDDLRAKLYVRKDMAQREWTRPSNQ